MSKDFMLLVYSPHVRSALRTNSGYISSLYIKAKVSLLSFGIYKTGTNTSESVAGPRFAVNLKVIISIGTLKNGFNL